MSPKGTLLATGGLLVLGALVWVSADLGRLQKGLQTPSEPVLAQAAQTSVAQHPAPPMASYPSFTVESAPGVEVVVHTRETPGATASLVFVHGASSGAWAWDYFFDFFGEEYTLYALSWRGHFDSPAVPTPPDSWDYVQDQQAVLEAIRARSPLPIHIVAHSYGAATVVLAEAQAPSGAASLQLLAPVVPLDYSPIQRAVVPRVMPRVLASKGPSSPQGPPEQPFAGMFIDQAQMNTIWKKHAAQPYSAESPLLIAQDGVSPTWQAQLDAAYRSLSTPMFFLTARYDNVVVPRRQHALAHALHVPAIELESGHYLPLDHAWEQAAVQIQANLAGL